MPRISASRLSTPARAACPKAWSHGCWTGGRWYFATLPPMLPCCMPRRRGWRGTMPWSACRVRAPPRCLLCWHGTATCSIRRRGPGRWDSSAAPWRPHSAAESMSGEEARQAFLDWLGRERRAAPLTVEAYAADIAGFLGFLTQHLGGEPDLAALAALRAADLRAWLAAEAAAGAGNATRARHLAAVRSFFRFLARRQGVDNPALKLIATPRGKRPVPRALGTGQAREVTERIAEMSDAAAMQARDTALFTLLYGCGLRIAEALALDVRDAPDAVLRVV